MSHFGFFNPPSSGHIYPAAALGRHLAARGHKVTFFNYISSKAVLRRSGLNLYPFSVAADMAPPKAGASTGLTTTLAGLHFGVRTVFAEACHALRITGVDALVIDQLDPATGTVADFLKLPFVTLSILPPIWLDDHVPPVGFGWGYRKGAFSRIRNHIGNLLFHRYLSPVISAVNRQRHSWGLPEVRHINDIFSKRAIITQLPECFDFPSARKPSHLYYTGPFIDHQQRRVVGFPWDRLDARPMVYASMGTIRNDSARTFRIIAEACAELDVQLVISLGGNPAALGPLAGTPIVVPFAPQLELLRRAILVVTHAGINTTLESLNEGVPLVAIPVSDDQPGVAARIHHAGTGKVVSFGRLSSSRLRQAIRCVLDNPGYRTAALRMREELRKVDSLELAANLVENALFNE
jgi:zeaxanthin glucosyltransferase